MEGKSSLQVRELRVLEHGREGLSTLDAEVIELDAVRAEQADNVNGR